MTQSKTMSILIMSCDKNIDILLGNLKLFERFWPNCNFPVFVSVENADFKYKNVSTIKTGKLSWSDRIKKSIDSCKTDYVLFTLDDFWIEENVDEKEIDEVLSFMKANASVSHFSFSLIPESSTKDFVMGHYMKRSLKGHAVLTEQMGIWKSSSLLKLLKSGENPWETELYGSERAKAYRKLSLYCVDDNSHSPIRYNNGWLVVRGKWNSIEVERLEKKLGLRIDLGSRPSEPFDGSTKDSFWWKVKKKICIIIWRARTLPFYRKKDIQ